MQSKIVSVILGLGVVGLGFLYFKEHQQLTAANEKLAALQAEKDQVAAVNADLQGKILAEADLKRMQEEAREAIKLRGEVNKLKADVSAAQKARDAAQKSAANAKRDVKAAEPLKPEENPYAKVYAQKADVTLPFGHGLLLGDFGGTPGKRTIALAIPTTDPANPNGIMVQTKLIEFSEEAAAKMKSFVLENNQSATLAPDILAQFLENAPKEEGVKVLASPRILTASGTAGSVFIGSNVETPGGPVPVGPQVDLTPTLLADGTVRLQVEAKLQQTQGLDGK